MWPKILVPKRPVLVNERFSVVVKNLQQFQRVTLRGELRSEKNEVYEASGHFIADSHGAVSLSKDPSFGGTYTGIDEMGLFWSLRPAPGQRRGLRYIPKNIDKPMKFKLELFDGHIESCPEKTLLASTTVLRTYSAPWVEKKEINVGRLRGSLFLPKGEGRFPGVLDVFGFGGLLEHRAALMASHGFATFALAFARYKDLPEQFTDVDLEYFLEAVEWFSKHEKVYKNGVGYVGVSYGGQVGLHVASLSSLVKAVVAINTPTFLATSIKYKNKLMGMSTFYKVEDAEICDGVVVGKHIPDRYPEAVRNCRIKVENISGQVLCVTGEDDQCLNASQMAEEMREAIPNKVTHLAYPRTGHLIEPPYMPFCPFSFHKLYDCLTGWGGNVVQHAAAQEHSWKSMLSFLKNNIIEGPKKEGDVVNDVGLFGCVGGVSVEENKEFSTTWSKN
eukprot:gene17004-18717_t